MRRGALIRLARRFRRAREGATAVEFGMVILPFMFMMFAVFELGMIFMIDSTLENAVIDTGRLVRTGQAQASAMTQETFKDEVCSRMTIFETPCEANLKIDVRTVTDFGSAPPDPMADGENFNDGETGYDAGSARELVVVSAWYKQTLLTPLLAQALSRLNDGSAWISATTAFRNEPFS